jgi:hypothetical protein
MPALESYSQTFVVACQPAKATKPAKGSFNNPTSRQQHKPSFGFSMLDDLQPDSCLLRLQCCIFTGVALVNKRDFNVIVGNLLNSLRQFRYLCPLLLVRRCGLQGQQISQRIYGRVYLRPLLLFGIVIASTVPTLRRRLKCASIKNCCRRLEVAVAEKSNNSAKACVMFSKTPACNQRRAC